MKTIVHCPVCHQQQYRTLFAARDRMFELSGTFTIVACTACSFVCLTPQPTMHELSRYYPSQKYYSYKKAKGFNFFASLRAYLISHYYSPTLASRVVSLFIPRVPAIPSQEPGGKVLDIGCGSGETLILLKALGWVTYGIDIDARAIQLAKKRGVADARVGSYTAIAQYPDGLFDAVRLYHVIEHLDDPIRCIELIGKKLKPGGELVIGTPNVASLVSRIFGTYWYNLDVPRHLFLFSPKTLKRIVPRAGFDVQRIEFCSAGGFVGSIQYLLREKFYIRIDLIHRTWLVLLFYPLEWLVDKMGLGDVFVLRARKRSRRV